MKNLYCIFPKDRVDDEPAMAGIVVSDYDKVMQEETPDLLDEPLVFVDFFSVIKTLQGAGIVQVYVASPRLSPEEGTKEKIENILQKIGFEVLSLEQLCP